MTKSALHKKFASSGPGGRTCGCCYPQVGKFRNIAKRLDTKRERRMFLQLTAEQLDPVAINEDFE